MLSDVLHRLTKRLYPKGRAFKHPAGGFIERLHKSLNLSETRAYEDAKAIHNSILPDNSLFTAADALQWERRLGLIESPDVDLELRKLAITRKINFPGVTPARQHWRWLEYQLQSAGFDVYVYENIAGDDAVTVTGDPTLFDDTNHGEGNHGDINHGGVYNCLIANSIYQYQDNGFSIGDNYRSTFFIGGPTLGSRADVLATRETEFRQLILKIKPVQQIGFLLIDYI